MVWPTKILDKLHDQKPVVKAGILLIVFLMSGVFLFYNSFRFSLPLGFGGLFAQMAEQIASNDFSLPYESPYYGPGGIPFAYPPLGLYIMALFIKLGIHPFTYMRFVPPLFSLLALLPIYLFTREFTGSWFAAILAVLVSAISPVLFVWHTEAGGIVRGLAFLFLIWAMYFWRRALSDYKPLLAVLAGILCGLTFLTHLYNAFFFAVFTASGVLIKASLNSIKVLSLALLATVLVTAPWLILVIYRYGFQIFLNILLSHDTTEFMDVLGSPNNLTDFVASKFSMVSIPYFLLPFLLIGLYISIKRQSYELPLTAALSLFIFPPYADRFIIMLAAIFVGMSSLLFIEISTNRFKLLHTLFTGTLSLAVVWAMIYSFSEIRRLYPSLHKGAFGVQDFILNNTTPDSRYLFVTGQGEAEWFPYLLQREPLISKWGSEWLGNYYEQRQLQVGLMNCRLAEDATCIKQLGLDIKPTDLLITLKADKGLNADFEKSLPECRRVNSISLYIVWTADCLIS